jgi:hypothetical protein
VTQQELDRQLLAPMMKAAESALAVMPQNVLADAGYWSYSQIADPVFERTKLSGESGRAFREVQCVGSRGQPTGSNHARQA